MRFDIYGRELIVDRQGDRWVAYDRGEGKRREADIVIPPHLTEDELVGYLADLFRELARPRHQDARHLS